MESVSADRAGTLTARSVGPRRAVSAGRSVRCSAGALNPAVVSRASGGGARERRGSFGRESRWLHDSQFAMSCLSPAAPLRDAALAHRRDIAQCGQMPPPPGATGHAARVRGGEERGSPSRRPTARAGDCSSDARRVYACLARVNVSPRDRPPWIRFRVESRPWRSASRHHGTGRCRARFRGTRTGSPFARPGRSGRSRAD